MMPQRRLQIRARRFELRRVVRELEIDLDQAILDMPNQKTKRARAELRGEIRAMRGMIAELNRKIEKAS